MILTRATPTTVALCPTSQLGQRCGMAMTDSSRALDNYSYRSDESNEILDQFTPTAIIDRKTLGISVDDIVSTV